MMFNICKKCQGKCCTSPYISKNELEWLPNPKAKKIKGNLYQLTVEKCQYLTKDGCSLKKKPLSCLICPFVPYNNKWVLKTKCPYWHKFTKEDLKKAKRVFSKRKSDWINL